MDLHRGDIKKTKPKFKKLFDERSFLHKIKLKFVSMGVARNDDKKTTLSSKETTSMKNLLENKLK